METTESIGTGGRTTPQKDKRKPTALDTATEGDLVQAAEEVASAVEQLYRLGDAYVGKKAEDRPYAVLGIAAGIGFVLGGGLAWRMTGSLVNVLGRMAVTHAVDGWVSGTFGDGRRA